ncbi:hypothetical protein ID866_7483 [Astraeus odoratus]|nr:hypothetical protein ID866_7483 [Astraeus odoratus]
MAAIDQTGKVDYTADGYNCTASFVYSEEYTEPIMKWLKPSPGDRIIDLGCGSGELTVKIQDAVGYEGLVVGIDCNHDMLAKASQNGLKNSILCDLQNMRIPTDMYSEKTFDAAFSNAALHWCKKSPSGVLDGVKRMLKDGGRFICEMGGHLNCIGVRNSLHHAIRRRGLDPDSLDPWYFPSVQQYGKLLESAGFRVDTISLVPRMTPLNEGGLREWLQLFARGTFLKSLSDDEAAEVMDEVTQMCEVDCKDENGDWWMLYARLRFCATLNP